MSYILLLTIYPLYHRLCLALHCIADLWNVYDECDNFAILKGHTGAVMELHFSLDGRFVLA